MKIEPSKGRLEFVDGTPVNQYPFNTKSRLNTFHWMQALQTIQRLRLDRDKPRKNYSNIIIMFDNSTITTWKTLNKDSIK